MQINVLLRARDEALLSLDETTIREFGKVAGVRFPQDSETFWMTVHKSRLLIASLPEPELEKSRQWLKREGYLA